MLPVPAMAIDEFCAVVPVKNAWILSCTATAEVSWLVFCRTKRIAILAKSSTVWSTSLPVPFPDVDDGEREVEVGDEPDAEEVEIA